MLSCPGCLWVGYLLVSTIDVVFMASTLSGVLKTQPSFMASNPIQGTKFQARRSPNVTITGPLCPAGGSVPPVESTRARSAIECSSKCRARIDACVGFSYIRTTKACEVYTATPQSYVERSGCVHYQSTKLTSCPIQEGVAPGNCSIPFTYSGQLYYACMPFSTDPCRSGCFVANRTWQVCHTNQFTAVNITGVLHSLNSTTGVLESIPVISVNNWIVVQQRLDGSLPFNRSWTDYVTGFGVYNGSVWIGLEKIYQMMTASGNSLRVEVQAEVDHKWYSAEYSAFYILSKVKDYELHVSGYSGDAGDALGSGLAGGIHDGKRFSTFDYGVGASCAVLNSGGFWYNNCMNCGINGLYGSSTLFIWRPLNALTTSNQLRTTRMMVKAN